MHSCDYHTADLCASGFGRTLCHNSLRNADAYYAAQAAAFDCQVDVPLFVSESQLQLRWNAYR